MSTDGCVGERGDGGGIGDANVTMSEISRAIQSTSSEISSSTNEVIDALRVGSERSGMDFMNKMEAR